MGGTRGKSREERGKQSCYRGLERKAAVAGREPEIGLEEEEEEGDRVTTDILMLLDDL